MNFWFKETKVAKIQSIDPFEVAREVNKDSQSGALKKELLELGHTLYSPAGHGLVKAHFPDGTIQIGRMLNGKFIVDDAITQNERD